MTDPDVGHRMQMLIAKAIAILDPEDRERRTATDSDDIRVHFDEANDVVELRWADQPLALTTGHVLRTPGPLKPVFYNATIPDTIEGLTA